MLLRPPPRPAGMLPAGGLPGLLESGGPGEAGATGLSPLRIQPAFPVVSSLEMRSASAPGWAEPRGPASAAAPICLCGSGPASSSWKGFQRAIHGVVQGPQYALQLDACLSLGGGCPMRGPQAFCFPLTVSLRLRLDPRRWDLTYCLPGILNAALECL